jgi:hypothetical protein
MVGLTGEPLICCLTGTLGTWRSAGLGGKDAVVEARELLDLAGQRFRWLHIVRICVELLQERERSSPVGPETAFGNGATCSWSVVSCMTRSRASMIAGWARSAAAEACFRSPRSPRRRDAARGVGYAQS